MTSGTGLTYRSCPYGTHRCGVLRVTNTKVLVLSWLFRYPVDLYQSQIMFRGGRSGAGANNETDADTAGP